MATISAYTSDDLKHRIDRIGGEEGRKPAQIGNTALQLYAALPLPARRAFQDLLAREEQSGGDVLDPVITEMTRVLLRARWRLTSEQIVQEARERGDLPEGEMSEEEITALAVEIADSVRERSPA